MKLIELYKSKKYGAPIVTIIFVLTCLIVSIPTYFDNKLMYLFASYTRPSFIWQYFSGTFEHTIFNAITGEPAPWFLFIHLGVNLLIIFLFGIIIEKNLGSNKMFIITLTALIINIIANQIVANVFFNSSNIGSVGASAVVYSYVPIALYLIYKTLYQNRNFKQIILYVYIIVLIIIYIVITLSSSFLSSNLWHLIATIVGIVFLLIFKKTIDKELEEKQSKSNVVKVKSSNFLILLWILPILMIAILCAYEFKFINFYDFFHL